LRQIKVFFDEHLEHDVPPQTSPRNADGPSNSSTNVKLKRAYEKPAAGDGTRILIDRLWPRGVGKSDAAIDMWMKDIAPSTELRRWFGHEAERWPEFQRRYAAELHRRPDLLEDLRELARKGPITLVFAAHDEVRNDAVVLRELLLGAG
jgi:uncharacterized protein YeaO (DUF488 family)